MNARQQRIEERAAAVKRRLETMASWQTALQVYMSLGSMTFDQTVGALLCLERRGEIEARACEAGGKARLYRRKPR